VSAGLCRVVVPALMLLSVGAASSYGANEGPPRRPVSDPTQPPIVIRVHDGGFHWTDAAVGAAATLATTLLTLGLALALRPDRRSTVSCQALSSARKEGP
jgi:hypothetical protein